MSVLFGLGKLCTTRLAGNVTQNVTQNESARSRSPESPAPICPSSFSSIKTQNCGDCDEENHPKLILMSNIQNTRPRARDLGIIIGPLLSPGPLNAITDVPRVKVGMMEKISGKITSDNPETDELRDIVRAGVTIVGTDNMTTEPLFAAIQSLQPVGELTGSHFLEESGQLDQPIAITGTHNVGHVYGAVHKAQVLKKLDSLPDPITITLPVVGETFDRMSHPASFAIGDEEVFKAIEDMKAGPVREGNVGGGTPMVSFGMKGGTGTSSRVVPGADGRSFTVGVLIQANHGVPYDLTIDGVPVGRTLVEEGYNKPWYPTYEGKERLPKDGDGSIIVVIATDAPLLPHHCKSVARRAGVGISRGGGGVSFGSGDIFICFSTARPLTPLKSPKYEQSIEPVSTYSIETVNPETLNALYRAASDATEEAILNALLAAEELDGYTGQRWRTLPVERVKELLRKAAVASQISSIKLVPSPLLIKKGNYLAIVGSYY
ncbi:peptidase family S58-domain-containing protein [Collybia nuda]|uniref:Peptidase family S58-domain-containing protein n=1 Tax=Collybia nuda TaxID=64659 RepID=A0A9P5YBK6_9AGAR|nr:peptidase family S58-domain-containing protein [Collybia nuda]